ncbi:hypothetical protein [Streptomyces aquilus]|uniref:hypothetical protein n=1 Tax=Streptomyces aquilus TaxID=2548456 RepID=UPI0036A78F70
MTFHAGALGLPGVPAHADAGGIGRALSANDGWTSEGTGITGGAAAAADHGFVGPDRAEAVAALGGGGATPAIIRSDAGGGRLSRAGHATDGYGGEKYTDRYGGDQHLTTHAPRTCGSDVGRRPTLHTKIDSADAAHRKVARGAGAGRLP